MKKLSLEVFDPIWRKNNNKWFNKVKVIAHREVVFLDVLYLSFHALPHLCLLLLKGNTLVDGSVAQEFRKIVEFALGQDT